MNNFRQTIAALGTEQKERLIASLCAVINAQRQQLLQSILGQRTRYITVVLEDIYQAQNASAVIRTAECLGLQELHIIENSNDYQLNPKVAQGASKWIEINRYRDGPDNTARCLKQLKQRGYKIVAMTLREDSHDLHSLEFDSKIALCFGSEEPGLSAVAHELADECVSIPMAGFTQSFNLSVSAGISLYQLTSRLRESALDWGLDAEDKRNLYIDWLSRSTPTGRVLLQKFIE